LIRTMRGAATVSFSLTPMAMAARHLPHTIMAAGHAAPHLSCTFTPPRPCMYPTHIARSTPQSVPPSA
jgi:hypothetical protein